jgi:predicted HicB family RNase H-like nuclease
MMEYKGYHADITYSDADKVFIGEVTKRRIGWRHERSAQTV